MPRNVRNFWITVDVDGRKSRVWGVGPVRKDGGFDLVIYQRSSGEIIVAMDIRGRVQDGRLTLTAEIPQSAVPTGAPTELKVNTAR